MLLHVDMAAGRAVPAGADVLAALDRIAAAQAGLPVPDGAGRAIGPRGRPRRSGLIVAPAERLAAGPRVRYNAGLDV